MRAADQQNNGGTQTAGTRAEPRPMGSIGGRVVGEDGRPLANVQVYLSSRNGAERGGKSAHTDADGKFRFDSVEAGVYYFGAFLPGYVSASDPASERGERDYYRIGDTATIKLIKGGVITGTVTNPSGEPVVGATVNALRVRDAEGRPVGATARFYGPSTRSTDDRGIYRLYGLSPGSYIVMVGGKSQWAPSSQYDGFVPVYYPSATRDAASEVNVTAGQEVAGIDIRYRGEQGHSVSGTVSGGALPDSYINVWLWPAQSMIPEATTFLSAREAGGAGFEFDGVADGDYDLIAQSSSPKGESFDSEPQQVSVRGADVTGLKLKLSPMGSISGRFLVEAARDRGAGAGCGSERQATPEEALIQARSDGRGGGKVRRRSPFSSSTIDVTPDSKGEFTLRNVGAGHYRIAARLPVESWYVRAITFEGASNATATASARTSAGRTTEAVARSGLAIRSGERVSGLTITAAEGAAQVRGRVVAQEGAVLPARLRVHLVPASGESADDPLRFSETLTADGSFIFKQLAPGRYRVIARPVSEKGEAAANNRPAAWEANNRATLRREAERVNTVIELKACQRVDDYVLRYPQPASK